jgi:hypothetical protein
VELVNTDGGLIRHYAIYLGIYNGQASFIANIDPGVRIINGPELTGFIEKYEITNVERPTGPASQRKSIIRRALSKLGERSYCIVSNNCEHFKNWALRLDPSSPQVKEIAEKIFFTGVLLSLIGMASNKKGLQKAGLFVMASPIFILFLILFLGSMKKN